MKPIKKPYNRNGSLEPEANKEITNAVTLAAMAEVEEMKKHPEKYKRYENLDEMWADLSK